MLKEEKTILWRTAATLLGAALPLVLIGKGVMFACLIGGTLCALLATKGGSLRSSLNLFVAGPLFWLSMAFLAAATLSSALGIAPDYSLHKTGQFALALLVTGLLFIALRDMPGRFVMHSATVLTTTVVAMCALAYADVFTGSERLSAALHGADKAHSYYRLNFMSSVLAVLLPFVWAFYQRRVAEGDKFPKMMAPWVLPFTLMAVFVCGGRAGWIAVVVALFFYILLAARYHHLVMHARQWIALMLTVVGGFTLYVLAHGWDTLLNRLELTAVEQKRGAGGGRIDIWNNAWEHMFDQPFTGIGVNAFRHLPANMDAHPHNITLQIGLETGLIGAVLALGIVLVLLRQFFRYAQGNVFGVAAFASLMAYLAAAQFNKSIFDLEWLVLFLVVMVLGWRLGWSKPAKVSEKAKVIHSLPRDY